jgi:cardiolipin synthase
VGTGPEFLKQGIRGVESVVEELLGSAKKELHVAAYVFTPQAVHVIDLMETAARNGVEIMLVINDLESQDRMIRERLKSLRKEFTSFVLVDLSNLEKGQLHAKTIVADRRRALIGSANFTWSGLVANYELGVLVEGDICWKLAQLIEALGNKSISGRGQ